MNWYHIIGNLAFILIACSFMVKDILWLRTLSITASLFSIFYNYHISGQPLWVPISWNLFFMSLNIYHVVIIIRGQKAIHLTDKERDLYHLAFSSLTLLEFAKLLSIAKWSKLDESQIYIIEGQEMKELSLIYNGAVEIIVGHRPVNELRDGQFIGEMSFLSNDKASATVKAIHPTEVIVWEQSKLKELMSKNPSIIYSLQSLMGEQMAKNLKMVTQKAV